MAKFNPIYVALDYSELDPVGPVVEALAPYVQGFKIGLELGVAEGPGHTVKHVREHATGENEIWYDGKFDDIPNTVSGASKAVVKHGVQIFNVMADAGIHGIRAAVENRGQADVYVVTVLTSFTEEDCHLKYGAPIRAKVLQFSRDAVLAGAQGIICSAQHLPFLAKFPELNGLKRITPGVRSPGQEVHDQKQVDTPANAMQNGAYGIVIGREATQADDPVAAVQRILADIEPYLKAA